MELTPGSKLGHYEIVSLLGKGGTGEVWRARDSRLGRDVAIKVATRQFDWRFEREARAAAALNHPNICQIYDVGPDYIVMEYIDGAPPRGPLASAEAMKLALGIAAGLQAAHERGITHRDLKPANILVTRSGVKLLDFGLASIRDDKGVASSDAVTGVVPEGTVAGTLLGTAGYMSPEQAQGKPADGRSDIFSFGLVLYELLSGRRAFAGGSAIEVMAAIVRDEPAPLNAPAKFAEIVMRCLRKAASARFQTMSEVRAALEQTDAVRADANPSIAVLPFANMSRDADDEFFSDGLAEEILNLLAKIPGLKVTARTSSFAFRGKEQDIRGIAETLNVKAILGGSVRRAGNRIRVTAQLINAADGYHLWSERYDRDLTDVFEVQDEISASIAAILKTRLMNGSRGEKRYTPKIAAYEAYLNALHLQWNRMSPETLEKSRQFYERAAELDPGYAMPHAGLAMHYHIASSRIIDPRQGAALGRQAALKALELDPSLPEAHAWLGILAIWADFDWTEARRRFDIAFSREPVPPFLRHVYGYFYLRLTGKPLEAIAQNRRALEEDPLNLAMRIGLAVSLTAAGKHEEALTEARRVLELDPTFVPAYSLLAMDVTKAPLPEALDYAEKGYALSPWYPINVGLLAGMLVRSGDPIRAAELIQGLGEGRANGAPVAFVVFHLLCGKIEKAAEWMEKAIEQRHNMVVMLLLAPPWEPMLRTSTRWPKLARIMNLPEARL
jgi:serine/threonine-protein kinase